MLYEVITDAKLERAMDALRCPPGDQLVSELSGGEQRRVALCRLLLKDVITSYSIHYTKLYESSLILTYPKPILNVMSFSELI